MSQIKMEGDRNHKKEERSLDLSSLSCKTLVLIVIEIGLK